MKIIYIIPARGGSKGLPKKNIKLLAGIPLIVHTINAAVKSSYKGVVVVSSDDDKIVAIAKERGAEVPFIRPSELAQDSSSTNDVIIHALEYYKNKGLSFDVVVLLQPTSPLRNNTDIENCIELFIKNNAAAVVSVCENEHHPLWSNELPSDGSMKNFLREEIKGKNRQQLPNYYRLNGAVYVSKVDVFLNKKGFIHDGTFAYIMPQARSVDIDTEIDFKIAELLLT